MLVSVGRTGKVGGMPVLSAIGRIRNAVASTFAPLDGFLYDADPRFLFDTSTGVAQVDAAEDPIGLWIDRSKGAGLGAELVTNAGPFVNTTGWAGNQATLSVSGGKLRVTSTVAGFASAYFTMSVAPNKLLKISCASNYVDGPAARRVEVYDTAPSSSPLGGFFSDLYPSGYVNSGSDGVIALNVYFTATAIGQSFEISNISAKELYGYHGTQPSAPARPTWSKRVNLLTYSEDFSNAAWNKNAVTITTDSTVAVDGTLTADKIVETAVTSAHQVYINPSKGAGNYTVSFYAKAGERNTVTVAQESGGDSRFTLIGAGTALALGANTVSISELQNGWYRCSSTFTTAGAFQIYLGIYNGAVSYLGDITKGLYLWGVQFEYGSTEKPYQRIAAATDYDTAGFLPYAAFLGTDDNMTCATGGGGSAGFFLCAAIKPTGGAGTTRYIYSDDLTATSGYRVYLDTANKIVLSAGNGTAFTPKTSTATVDVGTDYVLTVWDDGTNLNVQINSASAETVARPVVASGTASYSLGKSNIAASAYLIADVYHMAYTKGTGLTAAQREEVKQLAAYSIGLVL